MLEILVFEELKLISNSSWTGQGSLTSFIGVAAAIVYSRSIHSSRYTWYNAWLGKVGGRVVREALFFFKFSFFYSIGSSLFFFYNIISFE